MTFVKICGLTRRQDAVAAERAGARFGGVILAPGSPRTVSPSEVIEIFEGSALERCGVFVNESPDMVVRLATDLKLSVVQLHGDEGAGEAEQIRAETSAEVWKAVRPRSGEEFLAAVEVYGDRVDGILLDGWSPAARGGIGARFPWGEVAPHRDRLPPGTRLIAAGGLGPINVAEAVALLQPDGVDVSSGVERAPGIKDEALIREFVSAAEVAPARKGVA